MSNILECPYCEKEQSNPENLSDDSIDKNMQVTCNDCGKNFIYVAELDIDFHSYEADCLNGGEHDYKPMVGYPDEYFAGRKRCKKCSHETRDAV